MFSRFTKVASLILISSVATTLAIAQVNEAGFKKLDAYFKDQIDKKKSPAISIAIVEKGHIAYATGYGKADIENDVDANASTVYRIGSITKQFTATMIMQLVNEGKVKIEDPFQTVLPDTPKAWSKVTIKQLLNHTSGIKSYTELSELFEGDAMKPTKPEGIIEKVAEIPLDFEPGTKWNYNNTGYELLGMIIEKLDKRSFAESLKARITGPLKMDHTYFVSEKKLVPHRANGYSWTKDGYEHAQYLNMDWPYAAGSMESTVLDLAKWDEALYGEKILPKASLQRMWEVTKLADGTEKKYGFGWGIGTVNGSPIVEHGGGIHGFTTQIRRAPSAGITVIVLTNTDGPSNPGVLASEAMGMMDSSLKEPVKKGEQDISPESTQKDRVILQSVLDGKFDRSSLSPDFAKVLTDELLTQAKTQLGALGPIKALTFQREKTTDGIKSRIYRVKFDVVELTYAIATDSKGLIAGLEIHQ